MFWIYAPLGFTLPVSSVVPCHFFCIIIDKSGGGVLSPLFIFFVLADH